MKWYRRSRHLVAYWEDRRCIVHNYRTGDRVAADEDLFYLLTHLEDWTPARQLTDDPRVTAREAARVLTWLDANSLVESSRGKPRMRPDHDAWSVWGVTAALFHFGTRDVRFATDARATVDTKPRRAGSRLPSHFRQTRQPRTDLVTADFASVLADRRTWRRFGRAAAPSAHLSTALSLTFGVRGWIDQGGSAAALRTSPSAGARQPLEAYVLVRNVTGVRPGLYHFRPADCTLSRLRSPRDARTAIRRYLPGQPWYADASCVVLITAVLERTASKYVSPHAYRTILLEAGHFCQTFCLVATALQLAPFCTAALADSVIERDLALDPSTEPVIYAAGFGTRPRGRAMARTPRNEVEPEVVMARGQRKARRS